MGDEGLLAPPAVSHLRSQAGQMERSLSEDIREEREDLREAAEQTLNVILDINLDGIIRWVSPSWIDVIGTTASNVQGKPIQDLVVSENKLVFKEALETMKKDDSRSQIIRFTVSLGSASKLLPIEEAIDKPTTPEKNDNDDKEEPPTLILEGQGIMVYDHSSGGESHVSFIRLLFPMDTDFFWGQTMWMIRPWIAPREIKIDLPSVIAESLGSGAEILASHLTDLAESTSEDSEKQSSLLPVLCRICERQIPPWWFEKHTELCLQEHKAEMEVQICQENLTEHRHAIVKVLDALEARKARPSSGELVTQTPLAEYKGIGIPSHSTTASSSPSASRTRDPSIGHNRGRSFAVRRPQVRIVELILDLCDTAIEINTPAIKEISPGEDFRTQSPQSESRIQQVMQWQSPSNNTMEQEQGLALLCADSERAARSKVEAVLRHRRIIEYAERIRMEFAIIVQDCIDEAVRKAAGHLTDSTDEELPAEGYFDGPSSLARALKEAEIQIHEGRTMTPSTRSNSPKECPTPRSHGAMSILGHSRESRRGSLFFESENGDSDGSVRSSRNPRNESPVSEFGDLRRAASSIQRHRRSLILPGSMSPQRQGSPSRGTQPSSPLLITKPRGVSKPFEGMRSPITSPLLPTSDFSSPALIPHQHHRRQSSTTGLESFRLPPSPRLAPQARAVAPSIKDFEIIKPISKGAFGSVYLSKKKSTGDYYAIKALKKADMVAKNQVTNVKAERAIMMWQGESDFVAKLYWTFSSKDYLYLVMEYLNGGDCASLIKILGGLPEDWAKKYLGEVILGVEHLHSRGIVHRDLKPDNLLIDQKGHLKLTDFGLSRMGLIGRQKRVLNSSVNESAPDLLKHGPFAPTNSIASSRSTSFDFQGHHSPGSTPQITPDLAGSMGQPSYFNLNRDVTRRTSGQRSDSGGSDTLTSMFNSFSLNDSQRRPTIEELSECEGNGSPDYLPQKTTSQQASMMPPPMALFDPDDSNRRFVGTPDYLAPETVNGMGQDETSDWWSVGCILFEFLFGYPPFHAETPDKVFENILKRKIFWSEDEVVVSVQVRDLIEKLLCLEPSKRIGGNLDDKYKSGGEEIRNHSWFIGTNWDTLVEDEPQFVPAPENPEDTEYFDTRGATLQAFAEEMEDQMLPPTTPDYPERPHDALSRVRTQVNSLKRNLMPLHIPPHVRDSSRRRLSESVVADDFGSFSFKNLPVLEKANKDVIQKLRAEALASQNKQSSNGSTSPGPVLEGSPILQPPQRNVSGPMTSTKSSSVGSNSSPSRGSQPSSPLLVSFVTEGRRKTSSNSSSLSHQSSNSLQPGSFFEVPRVPASLQKAATSVVASPVKSRGTGSTLSPQKVNTTRARSQTVGSQESNSPIPTDMISHHRKRRSQVFDMSPSSSDNEGDKANALLRVQRRRQSSRRLSQITLADGPVFRPLDVLICEDHPVSRMVMEKLLEKLRCRTITVSNGAEAMRYAMSEIKFDIIMMEFKLPQINGADVARMIRDTKNANSQTPIVAITGYLKELQAPHYFDALIEKPATTSKLTDIMCRLCQWKAPIPGQIQPYPTTPSGLRQESTRTEDSPTSTSGYPLGSFRSSSREDSITSSIFDSEMMDDPPVIVNREWNDGGLGIHDDFDSSLHELHEQSVPSDLNKSSTRQPLSDKMKAKRETMEKNRHECSESGDDEDEELGNVKSPKSSQTKAHRGSKLGTEMMRTNSRGSVVSGSDQTMPDDGQSLESIGFGLIPPEILTPGRNSVTTSRSNEVSMDFENTPKQPNQDSPNPFDEEPTPRATSSASNPLDYMSILNSSKNRQ